MRLFPRAVENLMRMWTIAHFQLSSVGINTLMARPNQYLFSLAFSSFHFAVFCPRSTPAVHPCSIVSLKATHTKVPILRLELTGGFKFLQNTVDIRVAVHQKQNQPIWNPCLEESVLMPLCLGTAVVQSGFACSMMGYGTSY